MWAKKFVDSFSSTFYEYIFYNFLIDINGKAHP